MPAISRPVILALAARRAKLEEALRIAAREADNSACDILNGAMADIDRAMEACDPFEEEPLFLILDQYLPSANLS